MLANLARRLHRDSGSAAVSIIMAIVAVLIGGAVIVGVSGMAANAKLTNAQTLLSQSITDRADTIAAQINNGETPQLDEECRGGICVTVEKTMTESGAIQLDISADDGKRSKEATVLLAPTGGTHIAGFDQAGEPIWANESYTAKKKFHGITSSSFTASSQGGSVVCALDEADYAWCWGWNVAGQVGDGTTENRSEPTRVSGGHQFNKLFAKFGTVCGLSAEGELWCWGDNTHGLLGNGTTVASSSPVKVNSSAKFVSLEIGGNDMQNNASTTRHACADRKNTV